MDVGIARVMSNSERTETGLSMGTAYYMAPEHLKGTGKVDGRADQYALAVLLYEVLTGEVPAGRIKPLRGKRKELSKGFAAAIDRALEPNPPRPPRRHDGLCQGAVEPGRWRVGGRPAAGTARGDCHGCVRWTVTPSPLRSTSMSVTAQGASMPRIRR